MGGVLLVPKHVTLRISRSDMPLTAAANSYGVSADLMQWRLSASGALKRAERERAVKGKLSGLEYSPSLPIDSG
jgi:hypothetical protein